MDPTTSTRTANAVDRAGGKRIRRRGAEKGERTTMAQDEGEERRERGAAEEEREREGFAGTAGKGGLLS